MRQIAVMLGVLWACVLSHAEMRTWTLNSGETIEGEYVSSALDNVYINNADGKRSKISIANLSAADQQFIELANPPELSVDFLDSEDQFFVKPSPIWVNNSPISVFDLSFGARIKQTDTKAYKYEMYIEGYQFTKQVWDPSKYKMVLKFRSEPFTFSRDNRELKYECPTTVRIMRMTLDANGSAYPRGQRFAESLIIVRDVRGEIIAYNSTKKWLYNNLNKLEKLPVNAWLNDRCERVHPSSPPALKLSYLPDTY